MSATDGKLDEEEFETTRAYLADLVKNVEAPVSANVELKRQRTDEDLTQQPDTRNVRQRIDDVQNSMQSDLLLNLLKKDAGKGWFMKFDKDKSGSISKNELIDAMAATFVGKLPKHDAKSVVHGLWDCVDIDNSEEVDFQEFIAFREVLLKNVERFGE